MVTSSGTTPVQDWLARFAAALAAPSRADWGTLFAEECYWRDLLAFTWDIVTLEGQEAIAAMARQQSGLTDPTGFATDDPALPMTDDTQGWFTFKTAAARCRGHVQLRDGRAYVLLTAAVELIGHEETGGPRRPDGIEHRARKGRQTWRDEREEVARTLGHSVQPYCLIVGGGQNGLMLAARLKRLGVPALVVDALERPGDCWRARYDSLYLHDPIFLDHFPYLPFPDHWPLYSSKDKIADWLEIYAKAMEIDIWNSTRCTAATYDEEAGEWLVTVERNGETLMLRPKQLILATGLSGAKHIPAIAGAEHFRGQQYHSADHRNGAGLAGKRCLVIGSNNSAHDICVDLWEHGAQVTMIQRSPTVVVRADTMRDITKGIYYAEPGADIGLADLMGATMPFRPRTVFEKGFTDHLRQVDADFYERLDKSGFQLWHGEDETGFFMAYYRRAAGYYIDVGGSDLIAAGEIAVQHGEIAEIVEDGLRMADGTFLPADLIVYATGYRPMSEWVGQLISPEVERKVGPCWGLGSGTEGDPGPWEGELRNMWKPTAQEGLWFQGGNLMQCRFHSLHLALQLKAHMEGLPMPVYRAKREKITEDA
ncbi:MAG TPA: NAD(P)/FAD-dependent oxidoreductase [Sphingomonadaceae bacterium]|nr:NAD(P)/FAD-dependent oxidoreductase [Sphingomonadaceae bacterium]